MMIEPNDIARELCGCGDCLALTVPCRRSLNISEAIREYGEQCRLEERKQAIGVLREQARRLHADSVAWSARGWRRAVMSHMVHSVVTECADLILARNKNEQESFKEPQ